MNIPFFRKFEASRRVLLAGCGGGFDFISGVPLATWLRAQGKTVVHAALSFSELGRLCDERIGPTGYLVRPGSGMADYFPERHFVDWLASVGLDPLLVAFELSGAVPLQASYEAVVERYGIDTIVVVDGGVDSLAKGDEALLASVEEDAVSVVAVAALKGPATFLSCIGFGIDQYHGLCHYTVLENMAELVRRGGFLGTTSLQADTEEGRAFLDAVAFVNARQPRHKSVVANAVADAMNGQFGNVHATDRTQGHPMFVNPLLTLQWNYELASVVQIMGFRSTVAETTTFPEVQNAIRLYHARQKQRDWVPIPL